MFYQIQTFPSNGHVCQLLYTCLGHYTPFKILLHHCSVTAYYSTFPTEKYFHKFVIENFLLGVNEFIYFTATFDSNGTKKEEVISSIQTLHEEIRQQSWLLRIYKCKSNYDHIKNV